MKRVGTLAGFLTVRAGRRALPYASGAAGNGGDSDGEDDDDDLFDDDFLLEDNDGEGFDDELADMLAAFDEAEAGSEGDEDEFIDLDEPGEPELLEMLRDPDPESYNEAAKALRKLWREQEGPFAADELDAALAHLRSRASNRSTALNNITTASEALQKVADEYPDWPEP